jgi:hypothetical protein
MAGRCDAGPLLHFRMKLFFWNGQPTNLGRFGTVRKGSPLLLTDGEAEYVVKHRDRNYRPGGNGEKLPKDISDQLMRENHPENVQTIELNDLTFDELVKRADELKAQGYAVDHKVRSSRRNILCAIQNALRQGKPAKPPKLDEHAPE